MSTLITFSLPFLVTVRSCWLGEVGGEASRRSLKAAIRLAGWLAAYRVGNTGDSPPFQLTLSTWWWPAKTSQYVLGMNKKNPPDLGANNIIIVLSQHPKNANVRQTLISRSQCLQVAGERVQLLQQCGQNGQPPETRGLHARAHQWGKTVNLETIQWTMC